MRFSSDRVPPHQNLFYRLHRYNLGIQNHEVPTQPQINCLPACPTPPGRPTNQATLPVPPLAPPKGSFVKCSTTCDTTKPDLDAREPKDVVMKIEKSWLSHGFWESKPRDCSLAVFSQPTSPAAQRQKIQATRFHNQSSASEVA